MLMVDTAEIILNWLRETFADASDVQIAYDTELIEQGVLDSLQILNLVCFMEERFGVTMPVEEFVPENFRTVAALWRR